MAASGRRSPQSLRCSFCAKDWPLEHAFRACPCCGRETWEAEGKPPEPTPEHAAEIARARTNADFENYCRERVAVRLVQEVDIDLVEDFRCKLEAWAHELPAPARPALKDVRRSLSNDDYKETT